MKPLTISTSRISDFDTLSETEAEVFSQLSKQLDGATGTFLSLDDLINSLATKANPEVAELMVLHATSVQRLSSESGESVDEVIGALKAGLQTSGWDEEKITSCYAIFQTLKTFASSEKLIVASKASDLLFLTKWHLHNWRIVTDLRPVFDGKRDAIAGMLCTNAIHISYSDGSENDNTLQIPVGIDDLEKLLSEVRSALEKTRKLENEISNKFKIPSKVYNTHGK